jgi:hypothetical protein
MIAKPRMTSNPMISSVESGVPVGSPVTGTITVESTVGTIMVGPGTTVSWAVTEAAAFMGANAARPRTDKTTSVRIEIRLNMMFILSLGKMVEMSAFFLAMKDDGVSSL